MTTLTVAMGFIAGARTAASPNCDARPGGLSPGLIVVHGISLPPGRFGGPWIERLFMNTLPPDQDPYFATIQHLRVSSHVLIARDGALTQYVPFDERAWHAGTSHWRGRDACNDFSIGVELEGADTVPYTDAQYAALAGVARALMQAYPAITAERIAGHADVAPGRKTDPGPAFDWPRFRASIDGPPTPRPTAPKRGRS
jgi:AmpD protein